MIKPIEEIGDYFSVDSDGFLVNPASFSFIPEKWHQPIQSIKKAYIDFFKNELHSLYLRGSIVRGTFVDQVSDIDFIGLMKNNSKWEHTAFEKSLEVQLRLNYSFVNRLELMKSAYSENIISDYPSLAMVLKTQSICLWGPDVKQEIPHFKINRSLLFHYKWLAQDIENFLGIKNPNSSDYQLIMKMLVRCAYELVIERDNRFALDLYPAKEAFKKYYGMKSSEIDLALFYYLNPSEKPIEQRELILSFGNWLIEEIRIVLE